MIANYHTHTPRCNHAFNPEIDYVEAAMEAGFQILGFSDHTPQFFPGEYYSRMRMRPELLQDYMDTVLDLKQKFAGRLQIHLGLEVEYYPAIFSKLMEVLRDTPVEYMILGQHWDGNEEGEIYNGRPTDDIARLEKHCNQVIDAMHTGLFTYVAHPGILNFTGDERAYRTQMRRVCQAAKSCNLPLEFNFLGLREGRHYPGNRLWELVAEEGCAVVMGCDAHHPIQLNDPETEAQARQVLSDLGITPMETVDLIRI